MWQALTAGLCRVRPQEQVVLLVGCIADANGLKRRERNALVSQIEADLAGMR